MNKYHILLFFIVVSLNISIASAINVDKIAQDISDTSMSPFCPGRTISACPSGEAKNLREKIKAWLEQGYSEQAVRNQLSMIYGKDITGKPVFEGFGILAWTIPICFVILGSVIIARRIDKPKEIQKVDFDTEIERELEKRLSRN